MTIEGVDWRDAYRRRADFLTATIGLDKAAAKASSESKSSELANAAFRESIKNSPVTLRSPIGTGGTYDPAKTERDERIKKGGWDGFVASAEETLDQPVVKGILDALSIGSYTTAAIGNSFVEAQKAAKDSPNPIGDYIGELVDQGINHNPGVMGVKAAFGDEDSRRTWADVIKNEQEVLGQDAENEASKILQGVGGFIGDVALDPLTYLTVGATPIAKGLIVGAKEGTKAAKTAAGAALRDAKAAGASLEGTELERIANNSKGVIGTAIGTAKRNHDAWKAARKAEKADRRDIREVGTGDVDSLNPEIGTIGNDAREFQGTIDARQQIQVAKEAEEALAKIERDAKRREEEYAASVKPAEESLAEAKADVAGEVPVAAPGIKSADEITDPPPTHIENGGADIKEEIAQVKANPTEDIASPVVEAPKHHQIIERNAPVINKFESLWNKPRYNPKNSKLSPMFKAMSEPATIKQAVEKTDWDAVLDDLRANPKAMVSAGGTKVKASEIVKNADENGVEILQSMNLEPKLIKKHTSTMRRVPRTDGAGLKPNRKKGLGEFTGRTADSKDKKRLQKEAGKTRVKNEDYGPQEAEFADESLTYSVDEIFDEESAFNLDALHKFADENPAYVLRVADSATGVQSSMKLSQFMERMENASVSGMTGLVDKYLKSNRLFFGQFADDIDQAALASDKKLYEEAVAKWQAEKEAAETKAATEDEALDEILNPTYDLVENVEDVPNPNAWSVERAKSFGLDDDVANLSPQEITSLTTKMTDRDIESFIKAKEGGISKAELDELREFTGKTDAEEVAKEFIQMRRAYNKAVKEMAKEKPAPPSRLDEVKEVLDEINPKEPAPKKATTEDIENAQAEAADMANQIAKSPVALDEVAQQQFRVAEYDRVLKAPLPTELAGVISREHVNDIARQAVKASIEKQTAEADYLTGIQKMRTHTTQVDTGNAWRPDRWGSNSMLALHKKIWEEASALKVESGHILTTRRKAYMAILEVADKELRAMGIEPWLNHVQKNIGKKGLNHAANLSYFDVLKSLSNAEFGGVLNIMTTGTRAFVPTQVQGAAEIMVRLRADGKSEEEIRRLVIKQLVGSEKDTTKWGRPDSNAKSVDTFTRGRIEAMRGKKGTDDYKPMMTAIRGRVKDARAIADALMDPKVYRALNVQMMVNHAAHASTLGKRVEDLAEETVKVLEDLKLSGSSGDVLGYLRGSMKAVEKNFSPEDIKNAQELFNARINEYMSEAERLSFIEATKRADTIRPPAPVVKEKVEAQAKIKDDGKPVSSDFHKELPKTQPMQQVINKSHVKEVEAAEKQVKEMAPETAEEFEIIGASIAAAAWKKIHPFQKFVNPRLGLTDDIYRQANSGLHSIARQQAEFHGSLLTHLAKYGDESLLTDFRELQQLARESGGVNTKEVNLLPEGASESMKELYGIVSIMLDKSAYNVFARNGVGANHFNTLAKANGLHKDWRFEQGTDAATNSTVWMNWQGIEEKGVLDFLSRMHSIAIKASQDIAIAASFSKNFGKASSAPGLVKLTWKNRSVKDMEESVFYDLIDKDLYYPKEIAMQVTQVDKMMRESRHIDPSNAFGKFIVNVFDPLTNALKASQTTVRPGHWVISFGGDLMRNQLAGVNTIAPYKHSARILKAGRKMQKAAEESDQLLDAIGSAKSLRRYAASQEINNGFVGTSEGKGVVLFIGGKKRNVDYETMNKILRDVIILPKHRGGGVLEDRFVENHPTAQFAKGIEKATDFVTDNKVFSLNDMAATRDNFNRIALAVDYASKRKWKNLQDMKNGMEEYVTKWAPTSTDFTAWESKYSRRSLLYYTWLRGITPRIIDSAMTKPGVTTMVPKAMYNLAYANGLNPESIGNPFPEEGGLFPDYYANNVLGPQWKDDYGMWGINPSSPVIEVANTFSKFRGNDPLGNVGGALGQAASMSTPFARMPFELATGHQAGTEIPIEDKGQYLLDNLGGSYVSTLSRATGDTVGVNGILDRTDSAHKLTEEDQAEHAKLQLFNFLTGLKLTDYQSDSAIKAGAYDLADRYRKQAELEGRR